MEQLLKAVAELYLPLALGAAYAHAAKPSDDSVRTLSKAVTFGFLPLLLFSSTYGSGNPSAGMIQMGVAALIASATSLSTSYFITRDRELMLLSTYVNAGYLPIPVAYVLWGPEAVQLVGFYVLFNASIGYLLAPVLLRGSVKRGLLELARFPPIYAVLSGATLALLRLKVPEIALEVASRVGGAAPYLALFTVGMQVAGIGFRNVGDAVKVGFTRFIIAPAVAWLTAPFYARPGSLPYKVALLEAAMPPAVTSAILCSIYSPSPARAGGTVVLLTLLSTATLPLLLLLLA